MAATPASASSTTAEPGDDAALQAIQALEALLHEERGVVAALRPDRLPELLERKLALAEQVRAALATLPARAAGAHERPDPEWEARRLRLRAAATRVLAGAEANRLLLQDAVAALAEVRGVDAPAGTYDAHARMATYATGRVVRTL